MRDEVDEPLDFRIAAQSVLNTEAHLKAGHLNRQMLYVALTNAFTRHDARKTAGVAKPKAQGFDGKCGMFRLQGNGVILDADLRERAINQLLKKPVGVSGDESEFQQIGGPYLVQCRQRMGRRSVQAYRLGPEMR